MGKRGNEARKVGHNGWLTPTLFDRSTKWLEIALTLHPISLRGGFFFRETSQQGTEYFAHISLRN